LAGTQDKGRPGRAELRGLAPSPAQAWSRPLAGTEQDLAPVARRLRPRRGTQRQMGSTFSYARF